MNKYVVAGNKIGRYRCVTMQKSDFDNCLAGERGEIWEYGDGTLRAFKLLPGGGEKIFSFTFKDLETWISRLKVPADPHEQVYWANNPNVRHKAK